MVSNIKILITTHKPFKIPKEEHFVPIHAGREIAFETAKDGSIDQKDFDWLMQNTIGDNSGDNISTKNRLYSECTALYWAWKNYDKIGNPEYIGLMHYRRHFIFNEEYFQNKEKNKLEKALSYISEEFISENYLNNIGLNSENINKICNNYDLVVTEDSDLSIINNARNIKEDYAMTIAGTKVEDFELMVKILNQQHPEFTSLINQKIIGHQKSLYQMFIMKKELFFEYCEFLFNILFELEKQTDFTNYSINGKRSLGYLAEELLAVFVWMKEIDPNIKIKKLGCTLIEYPYADQTLNEILKKGCPKLVEYLFFKLKSFFLNGVEKQINKERYQGIRNQRKAYKKLQRLLSA
ncbi:DUF4422 domain-containing protein [bacterium]|nr:DUF4422 domain-containing protein [bacterium]